MTPPPYTIERCLRQRPFAYATVYEHPPLPYPAYDVDGFIKKEIPPEIATLCKSESNSTVFLKDGTWFTTWSMGSYEHAPDERVVASISRDMGKTWSEPRAIIGSSKTERISYGTPFVVPATGRIYLIFFLGARNELAGADAAYDCGNLGFVYSDDNGQSWSQRQMIELPDRDMNMFPGRFHGWLNQPPQIMPTGEVLLSIAVFSRNGHYRRGWMMHPSEVGVVRLNNILTERDPKKLTFTLLPEGPRGIRVDGLKHLDNPAVLRLTSAFKGRPEDVAFGFEEMTVVALQDGRWFGVGRNFLGSPAYTVSKDRGKTWSAAEPLRYGPEGDLIKHPMTMCPIAQTSDGRIVLCFTNNDGTERGARHVWDGNGRTRNPQWFAVAKQIPGEERNGGLLFGEPRILVEVDDSGEANLKTGISMPQFFEREGRYFVVYNINKEHLLLDEVPAKVLQEMTPR